MKNLPHPTLGGPENALLASWYPLERLRPPEFHGSLFPSRLGGKAKWRNFPIARAKLCFFPLNYSVVTGPGDKLACQRQLEWVWKANCANEYRWASGDWACSPPFNPGRACNQTSASTLGPKLDENCPWTATETQKGNGVCFMCPSTGLKQQPILGEVFGWNGGGRNEVHLC